MSQIRKLAVAGGTFAVALGIGFVMQNGDALAARMNGADVATMQEGTELPELPPLVQSSFLPVAVGNTIAEDAMETRIVPPTDLAAPAIPQLEPILAVVTPTEVVAVDPMTIEAEQLVDPAMATPIAAEAVASDPCTPTLTSALLPAATVKLVLNASCAPDTLVTFHHQGMIFGVMTDAAGQATVDVPALAETAVFIADIGGAQGAVSVIIVPDLNQFDRAVLQWQGDTGLHLHAREFGAGYDDAGHVWEAAARDAATALEVSGGYMVRLGDTAATTSSVAQIYTYPSGISAAQGAINLSVEAEVTQANCDRQIAAQTIQIAPGRDSVALDLEVTMPPCESVGEFLLLNNVLTDLTLALR